MIFLYKPIAGGNIERLHTLSDGIFAVAMTLLVLDLRFPVAAAVHSEHDLLRALAQMWPQLVMYLMSFMSLGLVWSGQQTAMSWMERSDHALVWFQMAFLFGVTMVPFSTHLLAAFHGYRLAFFLYWLNLALLGATLYVSWECAIRLNLLKAETPPELPKDVRERILTAQVLYGVGALLCVISTYLSIAFLVLLQFGTILVVMFHRRSEQ
jgi:uncharacterized membrane protein